MIFPGARTAIWFIPRVARTYFLCPGESIIIVKYMFSLNKIHIINLFGGKSIKFLAQNKDFSQDQDRYRPSFQATEQIQDWSKDQDFHLPFQARELLLQLILRIIFIPFPRFRYNHVFRPRKRPKPIP